jgi:hypothetical protein
LALVVLASACSDSSGPQQSPLDGLNHFAGTDSAGTPPPPPPSGTLTPGYFQGTVIGPSAPGAGGDSLATAPRVAGVVVSAYLELESDPVARVTTGADGHFSLPALPGGSYVVTVAPPLESGYGGVWATAPIHEASHLHPWWVVLWKR